MADKWTEKRDYTGEPWNDLLADHTRYAKHWERQSGSRARANAQHWRNQRWQKLDGMAAVPGHLGQDAMLLEQRNGDELAEQSFAGGLQQAP